MRLDFLAVCIAGGEKIADGVAFTVEQRAQMDAEHLHRRFELGLDDWMMQSHRWLGTGIGIGAFALGVFALRRPEQDRGSGMIVGLSILTAAILVQGWFGGALVHGVDHLNW